MVKNKNAGFSHLSLVALFCIVTIMLIVLGVFYYRSEAQYITDDKYDDLSVIARLKADSIKEWRRRVLADVTRVPGPLVKKDMILFLQNPTNLITRKGLQTQLNINRKIDIYADALFLDTKGNILLSDKPDPAPVDIATMKAIKSALKDRRGVLSDLFRSPKGHIYIDAVAPIPDNTGRPIAIVVLRSKAADFLYPLIQSWPISSKTAETLLVRRDGDSVLFLNELRHRSNTALTLRIPLTKTILPSVQTVLGNYGRLNGRDYRGVEVLAVSQPVPESPWFIVAKVDTKEILTEIKYRAWVVSIIILLLVMILASLLIIFYRNQQEVERKKAAVEIMKNAELFRVIFENSTVGKSLTAPDGQMLQINKTFAGMLGYTIEEIQQINFAQITHPDDIAKSQESIRSLLADEQIIYQMEKRYIHKNGDIVWANVSTTLLRDEHRSPLYLITNIVDITERKRSELQREALLEEINKLNAELEHRVAQRTAELSAKTAELEKINKVFVDRELRMRELKERIAELEGIKDVNGEM